MSPYAIAATAAERAKRSAAVHPSQRVAYARRVAFRARSAANAHTAAYFTA